MNPKKHPEARRRRAAYPRDEHFQTVEFKIPQLVGPDRSVFCYAARRSDGATVTRKSPSERDAIRSKAISRRLQRERNAEL